MKFAIATLFTLALAMGIECSIIPLGHHTEIAGHGLAYTAVSGPTHAHVLAHAHAPAAIAIHAAAAPWVAADPWLAAGWAHGGWHGDWAGHHAHVVVAPAHEGSYLAKTRGAVHAAPLAGHASSAAAINVAPAPGTV